MISIVSDGELQGMRHISGTASRHLSAGDIHNVYSYHFQTPHPHFFPIKRAPSHIVISQRAIGSKRQAAKEGGRRQAAGDRERTREQLHRILDQHAYDAMVAVQ